MSHRCPFCRISRGEAEARIIYQNDELTAFHDANPQAPVHVLIIPNRHIENLNAVTEDDGKLLSQLLLRARRLAAELDVAASGYRLVFNVGRDGGQSIDHLHLHLLGGRGLHWPPG
jgi:histidine triad (HIT) family protein